MRFSILPLPMHSWDEILDEVRHCDASGWDGVWFEDHFMPDSGPFGRPYEVPVIECWSVLGGLAAATDRLRIGSLVSCNSYRHPAVLANMVAAVDQVSHGRVVLGIGAGWQVTEHDAYGIDLAPAGERLDRFEEAVQIVLGLLRAPRTTFRGKHYSIVDAPNEPKPVQARLPLLIGGGGEKRTMRIAAEFADEWNIWSLPDLMRQKRDVLHRHCDAVGRDPSEIGISTQALLCLSTDEEWLANVRSTGTGFEQPTIIGTPEQIIEIVAAYRDAGVTELIVPIWTMGSIQQRKDTYDLFINEVAPAFRESIPPT
jgi:F420-dependent oxidoreductase-like protein